MPPSPVAGPVDGGTVFAPLTTDPTTLNWVRASDTPAAQIGRLVGDSLVDHGPDLRYLPRLAERWEISADQRVITFHLRPGVTWHDGTPFTASDVVFSYRWATDPGNGAARFAAYFSEVEAVEALTPLSVRVRYRTPFAPALQGWEALLLLPAHRYREAAPGTDPQERSPIGTGPFRLERWRQGEEIVLTANPRYWRGRPHLDSVVLRIVPDNRTAAGALAAGELTLATLPQSDPPPAAAASPDGRIRYKRFATLAIWFIAWNGDGSNPFFADRRVRRAMTLALDREGFRRSVLHGLGQPATSTFVPGTWAYDPSLVPLPYDPAGSARLLDEAGWTDSEGDGVRDRAGRRFEFTLTAFQGNPIAGQIAQVLQEALAHEGVRMRIETLDWPAFVSKLRSRRYQAQISTWLLDVDPDPYDNWHSSQIATGNNVTAYADAEVDRYCEAGRATFDLAARAAAYREVQARLHRDQPMTFLFHPEWVVGVDARLRGFRVPLSGPWRWFPGPLTWWLTTARDPLPLDAQG